MSEISALKYIPQELKYQGLWCCWKLTEKGKVPFTPNTGAYAKSNDKSTFVTYMTLLQNVHKYLIVDENGKQKGGVGLGIFNGFSAIDIDHCVDENGNINDMARDIIDYCDSYTEYSPSKTGIRIIFKTKTVIDKAEYYINNHNNGLEIYISDNTNKFVSITGNRISGDTITEVDIQYLLDKYMKKNAFDINRIIEKDNKFAELWNGSAPGSHANESELDMALCCKLAYYLKNDVNEIKTQFMMSPYYASKDAMHKKKWNSNDYAINTINSAVNYIGVTTLATKPAPNSNKKYELNDTGNSHRFVERFGDDIKYNVDNCKWMLWNDIYWQYDVKDKIKDYVEILAEEMAFESNSIGDMNERVRALKNVDYIYNTSGKNNLLKEAQHIGNIPIVNDDLDRNPYLLCCMNGTLDLRNGDLLPNEKSNMISQVTGGSYVNEQPKQFLKFFSEIFQDNKRLMNYVHKALGYSISNTTREQCMFILLGDGNNGKSLLLEVIREALGTYAISTRPQLLTEQRNGNSNLEEVARLKGKRFIAVEEVKSGDRLDESLVKSLTSGIGNQVARFLYGNSFEFPVTGKIWMATNYMPVIKGTDKGIWRRIKIIPVTVDFTGKEDRDLKYKLLTELPGILNWLVEGYKKYMVEGLAEPSEVSESIKTTREEFDVVQKWINECCELGNDKWCSSTDLFTNFNAYCKQMKEFELSQTQFGRNMGKKFTKKIYSGKNVYFGIAIRHDSQELVRKVAFDHIKVREDI